MSIKEAPPIGRPGIDCKKAINCSNCLPRKIEGKKVFDCENIKELSNQRKPAEQVPLSRIEKVVFSDVFIRKGRVML